MTHYHNETFEGLKYVEALLKQTSKLRHHDAEGGLGEVDSEREKFWRADVGVSKGAEADKCAFKTIPVSNRNAREQRFSLVAGISRYL